jgi:hypothetical protein
VRQLPASSDRSASSSTANGREVQTPHNAGCSKTLLSPPRNKMLNFSASCHQIFNLCSRGRRVFHMLLYLAADLHANAETVLTLAI